MKRIRTAARLHFGLLALPEGEPARALCPERAGAPTVPARWFGGVGLMVQQPGFSLAAEPAAHWCAAGPLAQRALEYARTFVKAVAPAAVAPQRLVIEEASPEHVGLGSGTQLGLAVAWLVSMSSRADDTRAAMLARTVGRGARSALGIHGFEQGGFLVDGGKRIESEIAPLVARCPFPEDWPIILIVPRDRVGRHGKSERDSFLHLRHHQRGSTTTDALCRLVLLGMLPAVAERDFAAFAEALHDFNARAGELFAPVQEGIYSSTAVAQTIELLRSWGIRAAGQSSWGPTVFAITEDQERADWLVHRLQEQLGLAPEEIVGTRACNHPAQI